MASTVNPVTGSQTASASSASSSSQSAGIATAPTEEMFLNLLVAQIQNQDPLNPTDSTQFVSQLAQFSELEQVIGIRSDIQSYMSSQAGSTANSGQATPTPSDTPTNTTTPTNSTTPTGTTN